MNKYDIARKELELFFAAVGDDMARQINAGQAAGKHAHQLCVRSYVAWQALARADSGLSTVVPRQAARTRAQYEKLTYTYLDVAASLEP